MNNVVFFFLVDGTLINTVKVSSVTKRSCILFFQLNMLRIVLLMWALAVLLLGVIFFVALLCDKAVLIIRGTVRNLSVHQRLQFMYSKFQSKTDDW